MDSLCWNSLSSCVRQRLWSHRQPENRENLRGLDADCSMGGGNVKPVSDLFNSSYDIGGSQSCNLASDTGSAIGNIQQLAPALDSINVASNLKLLQRQEAIRLESDTQVADSGAGTTWEHALGAELHAPFINMIYSSSPLSSLMPDIIHKHQVTNGMEGGTTAVSADSLESLDCLLSATNSNTDTSVEDDGISMLFSDSRNVWDFNSGSAISSGESENNRRKEHGNEACRQVRKHEEINSRCFPSPSSGARPSSSKIKKDQVDMKTTDTAQGSFQLITEKPSKSKKPRLENHEKSSNINFQQPNSSVSSSINEPDTEAIAQVKEMIYRAAVFRPVNLDLDVVGKPKRKNVKISSDPQTVAARERRKRISERVRILQRLVPGGNKMDTASVLDEAANYLKFLRSQVKALETVGHNKLDCMNSNSNNLPFPSLPFHQNFSMQPFFPLPKP